jgi:hypothetical protein
LRSLHYFGRGLVPFRAEEEVTIMQCRRWARQFYAAPGGRLTRINVTRPAGTQQASRLDGEHLSAQVTDWVEARI